MTELCKLAIQHGTDKVPARGHHGYTPIYDAVIGPRRGAIRELLEIGIGTPGWMARPDYAVGASLRMWRDYLPGCRVTGIDVLPDSFFSDERIETYLCDQNDTRQIAALCPGRTWDIVVDDGSHLVEHQTTSLRCLWSRLMDGGLYFIEDVWRPNIPAILDAWVGLPGVQRNATVHYVNGYQYGYPAHDEDTLIVLEK